MTKKPVKQSLLVKAERRHNPPICQLPLTGGRPCLDFVNTIDWRLDQEWRRDLLGDYSDLLAFTHRLGLIDDAEERSLSELARKKPEEAARAFAQARAFRDALITIIDDIAGTPSSPARGAPRPAALSLFDAALRRARSTQSFAWKESRLWLISQPPPRWPRCALAGPRARRRGTPLLRRGCANPRLRGHRLRMGLPRYFQERKPTLVFDEDLRQSREGAKI